MSGVKSLQIALHFKTGKREKRSTNEKLFSLSWNKMGVLNDKQNNHGVAIHDGDNWCHMINVHMIHMKKLVSIGINA